MNGRVAVAAAFSIALIGATLWPLHRDPSDDGYPLSTYPMFSWKRPTKLRMTYGLGMTVDGQRRYLTPRLAGSLEVLQARAIFERAANSGRVALDKLCTQIAGRVAADADYHDVATIRIVDGTHDAIDFLVHDKIGREVDRVKCAVQR